MIPSVIVRSSGTHDRASARLCVCVRQSKNWGEVMIGRGVFWHCCRNQIELPWQPSGRGSPLCSNQRAKTPRDPRTPLPLNPDRLWHICGRVARIPNGGIRREETLPFASFLRARRPIQRSASDLSLLSEASASTRTTSPSRSLLTDVCGAREGEGATLD